MVLLHFCRYLWYWLELFQRFLLLYKQNMHKLDHSTEKMPPRKLSSCWRQQQWRKRLSTTSPQWQKILAGIKWYLQRGRLHLGRPRGAGNFTAWAKNQPNNFGEEDCVHALGVEHNYEWNDVKCSDCHQYTCKKGSRLTKKYLLGFAGIKSVQC